MDEDRFRIEDRLVVVHHRFMIKIVSASPEQQEQLAVTWQHLSLPTHKALHFRSHLLPLAQISKQRALKGL